VPAEFLGLLLPIELPVPEADQRERCWHAAMARHRALADAQAVQTLAARFRLAPLQIAAAVGDALLRHGPKPTLAQWQSAARAQSGQALSTVADKVMPKACWDDIVLPADCLVQLRELCNRVEQHERVFQDWGFARKLSRGRGTAALFSGGSGTGKTMAAEVIANALGLDLYRIDLARVVDKYIGETEKNLDRVFDAAQSANAILFFDEADALFGKRCEVKDAHDRYANIEVSYLLQKMEEYDGLAILASNLADNLDEAFTRRLAFAIHFPFPDEAARLDIWRRAWPAEARLAADLDLHALARDFKLSGANIASVALAACFAAAAGPSIQREHVVQALRREFEKLSRPWPSSASALARLAIPLRGRGR
jgi:SpoVK/Ycf46/Vps4 family AAA+-type ATPase